MTTTRERQAARQVVARAVARQRLAVVVPRYPDDPVGFITQRLGEHLWSKQAEVAESVRDHRHTAVPSAHGTGKSFVVARLVAWWLEEHEPGEAFAVTTAPTFAQVRAILWREINRAHTRGRLRGYTNQTEWHIGNEIVAFGRKPADYDEEAFQGIHARYVLVVLDEASGIPPALWEAVETIVTNPDCRVVAIGNPTDPTGRFAQVCQPDTGWNVIHIDALASPNFTDEVVPARVAELLVSEMWVDERRRDWGEDSPVYEARVRGRFPEDAEAGVVLLSDIRACQQNADYEEDPDDPDLPVELGVDVGAGGDQTVIRERRGMRAGRNWRHRTPASEQAVGHIVRAINETGATRVKVDTIGIGWGVVGHLRTLKNEGKHSAIIVPVDVSKKPQDPVKFPKLRSEIWWAVGRELSQQRAWDLSEVDETTVAQLVAPKYTIDPAGRIQVELKKDTIKRIGRSPDDADALLLAYYRGSGEGSVRFL